MTAKYLQPVDLAQLDASQTHEVSSKLKTTSNCDSMVNFYKFRLLPEYTAMLQPRLTGAYSPTAPTVATWNQYEIQPRAFDEEVKGGDDGGIRQDFKERDQMRQSRSRSRSPRGSRVKPLLEEDLTYIFLKGIQPSITEADIINAIAKHIRVFVIICLGL